MADDEFDERVAVSEQEVNVGDMGVWLLQLGGSMSLTSKVVQPESSFRNEYYCWILQCMSTSDLFLRQTSVIWKSE